MWVRDNFSSKTLVKICKTPSYIKWLHSYRYIYICLDVYSFYDMKRKFADFINLYVSLNVSLKDFTAEIIVT